MSKEPGALHQLLALRAQDFYDLIEQNPAIHETVQRTVAERLEQSGLTRDDSA